MRLIVALIFSACAMAAAAQQGIISSNYGGPSVDPRQYGADPSGVADSADAIRAAVGQGGRLVRLPCGTFRVSKPILLPSNTAVVGSDNCTVLTPTQDFAAWDQNFYGVPPSSIRAVFVNADWTAGNSNIEVAHLRIDTDVALTTGVAHGLFVAGVSGLKIHDVTYSGGTNGGEFFQALGQPARVEIYRNVATQARTANVEGCIDFWDGATDVSVTDNLCDGGGAIPRGVTINGISSGRSAPSIGRTSARFTVSRNIIKNHKSVGVMAVGLTDKTAAFTGSISGTTLTVETTPIDTAGAGVFYLAIGSTLSGSGVTGGTTIVSQISGSPGGAGTYQVSAAHTVASTAMTAFSGVYGLVRDGVISENIISGMGASGPFGHGVWVGDAENIVVRGNVVSQAYQNCIYIAADVSTAPTNSITASGNNCASTAAGGGPAISVGTGSDAPVNVVVDGGVISGATHDYPVRVFAGAVDTLIRPGRWAIGTQGASLLGGTRTRIASAPVSARTSSAFSKTSDTTLADIPGLSFQVEKGRTYRLTAAVSEFQNQAGGQAYALGGTATFSSISVNAVIACVTTAATRHTTAGRITALGSAVSEVSTGCAQSGVSLDGLLTASASGTLTIQFAQQSSNAAASTVAAGATAELVESP